VLFRGALLALACWNIQANDVIETCWRGQTGSTEQQWTFVVSNSPAFPEAASNPFGLAQATLVVGPFGKGWLNQRTGFGTNTGFWDLGRSGSITLTVPGQPNTSSGAYQYLAVEIIRWTDLGIYRPAPTLSLSNATLVGTQQLQVGSGTLGVWMLDQSVWRLESCLDAQTLTLLAPTNGAIVDQIVVDTLCVDLACPMDLIVAADPGRCSKSKVRWTLPAWEGCMVTNRTCFPASGAAFPVGTTEVSCVSTDAMGYSASCRFHVTVTDPNGEIPPLIIRRLTPTNDLVEVSWPRSCIAYTLQETVILNSRGPWTNVQGSVEQDQGRQWTQINTEDGARWYRLIATPHPAVGDHTPRAAAPKHDSD
jgi:hypothetical protein